MCEQIFWIKRVFWSILDQIYLDWEYFETLELQILLRYLAGQSQGPFLGAIDEEMGMQWECYFNQSHLGISEAKTSDVLTLGFRTR